MITLEKFSPSPAGATIRAQREEVLDYQRLETVLLIEDDEELNSLLSKRFRSAGLMVARALDGASGLEMCRWLRPDLIVLDLGLPRLDGGKVLHHMRMEPGMRQSPILVITGSSNEALIRKAENWGVRRVLRKPVSPKELVRAAIDALEGV